MAHTIMHTREREERTRAIIDVDDPGARATHNTGTHILDIPIIAHTRPPSLARNKDVGRAPPALAFARRDADCRSRCSATQAELLAQIAGAAGQAADVLTLSCGFPPRPLSLEPPDAPVSSSAVLQDMEVITVAVAASASGSNAPSSSKKGRAGAGAGRGRGRSAGNAASTPRSGVHTLGDVSGGGGGGSSRKRPAASASGGGKRRVGGALQLGSEEGIGSSLVNAIAGRADDPAQAFLKAAAKSALEYHVEEVQANERFGGAQSGGAIYAEVDATRRLDGEATECDVTFKVGRSQRTERFAVLSRPELRAVIQAVLEQLPRAPDAANEEEEDTTDAPPTSHELLKPFKMAWASPRVFWNMARAFDGDVGGGLRQLLPMEDWSFLEEREKRRSSKAHENARQAAADKAEREAKRAKREAKKTGKGGASSPSSAGGGGGEGGSAERAVEPELEGGDATGGGRGRGQRRRKRRRRRRGDGRAGC